MNPAELGHHIKVPGSKPRPGYLFQGEVKLMKVISFQEKKRKKLEDNLAAFQENFWEWVFAYRWKPCPNCTRLLMSMLGQEHLWSNLCTSCCSYFYFYQVLYVRAIKTICQRGEKVPSFKELEDWYYQQESNK
jgi:hypothetical protein